MKYVLIGLSFLTLTFNALALTPQDIYSNSVTAVLYLQTDKASGTGFFVEVGNEVFLITNHHMIKGISSLLATSYGRNTYDFSDFQIPFYADEKSDIAVLKLLTKRKGNDTFLKLSDKEEKEIVGDDSFWIGHPGGLWSFTFSRGYIGKIQENGNPYDLQIHGVGFHGSSGSPFLNKDGRVIGILSRGNSKTETIKLKSPINGEEGKFIQEQEYEEIQFGSSKESIFKALAEASVNHPSNTIEVTKVVADDSSPKISTENIEHAGPKNDLASLIRELKAYAPPSEVRLGSR